MNRKKLDRGVVERGPSFRDIVMDYYLQNPVNNPYSLTLTMKQGYEVRTPKGSEWIKLDGIKSSTNLRHFRNRLNKKIFGNTYTRFNKQIGMFSVMENDTNHRFHLHLIIEKPSWFSEEQFKYLVWSCWNKTKFGYHQIHMNELSLNDEKTWLRYLTKKRTKDDLWFSIDWENCTNFQTSMS